jgi:FAD/FMN-containing dehydrogenase
MFKIKDFQGMQYSRDTSSSFGKKDYQFFNQQYATTSYQAEHDMNPALIVQPKEDEDVIKAVQWARDNKVSVAVRSGGHQYSGASSTGGKNIQIDLTNTYKDMMVLEEDGVPDDRALVLAGVSNRLQDFNDYLRSVNLFVPHGQCA